MYFYSQRLILNVGDIVAGTHPFLPPSLLPSARRLYLTVGCCVVRQTAGSSPGEGGGRGGGEKGLPLPLLRMI